MSEPSAALGGSPAEFAGREVGPAATSVRWYIMGLVVATSILTYLDRLNLSIAGKYIQDEFAIPVRTMGWIFSAFLLGYALFQIPGGYAADRFGPRRLFVVVITSWSVGVAALGSGFGGMVFALLTGSLIDHYSFLPAFIFFGLIPIVSLSIVWTLMGPLEPTIGVDDSAKLAAAMD